MEDRAMPYANIVIPAWDSPVNDPGLASAPQRVEANGVRLQWSKGEGGHVQVVTARFLPGSPGYMPDTDSLEAAQWATLDRHTINELIRNLRQARDDAFGKDA